MQVGIKVLVVQNLDINKSAVRNKAVQVLTFGILLVAWNKSMQVGKFSKINKPAGCNKAMQVGIFQISILKKSSLRKK